MTRLWDHQKIKDAAASGQATRKLAAPFWISHNKATAVGSPLAMLGAALECNATLKAMRWSLGSYKPVTRWINDAKVASINTVEGLQAMYCNPGEHQGNC